MAERGIKTIKNGDEFFYALYEEGKLSGFINGRIERQGLFGEKYFRVIDFRISDGIKASGARVEIADELRHHMENDLSRRRVKSYRGRTNPTFAKLLVNHRGGEVVERRTDATTNIASVVVQKRLGKSNNPEPIGWKRQRRKP